MRVRAEGRQAIRRFDPGTLLNQCRLHKTKKHTRSRASLAQGLRIIILPGLLDRQGSIK